MPTTSSPRLLLKTIKDMADITTKTGRWQLLYSQIQSWMKSAVGLPQWGRSSQQKSGVIIRLLLFYKCYMISHKTLMQYSERCCMITLQTWLTYLAAWMWKQLHLWSVFSSFSFLFFLTDLCHPVVPRKVSQRSGRLSAGKSDFNLILWFEKTRKCGGPTLNSFIRDHCRIWIISTVIRKQTKKCALDYIFFTLNSDSLMNNPADVLLLPTFSSNS